jgi:electron transfer flavoprotein alpha subunit
MAMNNWIIAAEGPEIGRLLEAAREIGGAIKIVCPSEAAAVLAATGVDAVYSLDQPPGVPIEALAGRVAQLVAAAPVHAIIAGPGRASRALAAATAARCAVPVVTAVSEMGTDGEDVTATRLVLAGQLVQTLAAPTLAAIFDDPGPLPAPTGYSAPVDVLPDGPLAPVVIDEVRPAEADSADLADAARVVGVGRGLTSRDDLDPIRDLAAALGAQVACSLPLAEDLRWLPKDRCVGVSGRHIAPRLYLAVGISGQPQHLEGVRGAETIVAINSNRSEPIFERCDFAIEGDLHEIVPALAAAVRAKVPPITERGKQ